MQSQQQQLRQQKQQQQLSQQQLNTVCLYLQAPLHLSGPSSIFFILFSMEYIVIKKLNVEFLCQTS
jgi:hypothetical protein